ncbi:MAG: FtsX-like permease family protein, partial [Bacteroidales bacterium]|nr:FtsX-like permease family protein [Bacteroidales bacterium]
GVRKCYGAEEGDIAKLLFKEAALHFSIALILASAIILGVAKPIENLLGASLGSLFSWQTIAVAAAVSIVVLLVSGLIPANIFMRVPVSTAFRNYRESKRRWKLVFLGIQFTFSIFLICVLFVFGKQYNMMLNDDLGYEYDRLLAVDMVGADPEEFFRVKERISQLPFVQGSAITSEVPITGSSGNNVYLPDDERELFNVADQYYSSEGAADVLGIKFIDGREARTINEVAVSRRFVERMQEFADWSDGAIGKGVVFTEHSKKKTDIFTICGVYEDYKIGSVFVDDRPSIRFGAELSYDDALDFYIRFVLIKVDKITAENISQIQAAVDEVIPERTFEVAAYEEGVRMFFADIRKIKNAILLGGLFSLIISLMGLIGYIRDETQRRSAEVAIRKINGAVPAEIVKLFVGDIMTLMAVALVIGDILALLVGNAALEMFQQKAEIGILSYVIGDIIVLTIIMAIVIAGSLKISNSNPVDSLKNE